MATTSLAVVDRASVVDHGIRWDERLRRKPQSGQSSLEQDVVTRWRKVVDPCDTGAFALRLDQIGLDPHSAGAVLAGDNTDPNPDWLSTLIHIRQALQDSAKGSSPQEWVHHLDESVPELREVPFGHALWPIGSWAWSQVIADVGPDIAQVCSEQASKQAICWLMQRLSRVLSPSLMEAYPLRGDLDVDHYGRDRYIQACWQVRDGGFDALLAAFPVSGRLIAQTVRQWQSAVTEMLSSVHEDQQLLAQAFGSTVPVRLLQVSLGAGDCHNQGRTATLLTLQGTSGPVRIVRKPHDMRPEAAFTHVMHTFVGINPAESPAKILAPSSVHGYARFIEHRAAEGREALQRFYYRAGHALALLYVLRVSDCHYDNVIAAADELVFIDPETMLSPVFGSSAVPRSAPEADPLGDSVLRLLLLPRWAAGPHSGQASDVSGLGSDVSQTGRPTQWVDINTDAMRMGWNPSASGERTHLPVGPGVPNPCPEFVEAFSEGFSDGYRKLLEPGWREWLRAQIVDMAGMAVRLVLRPTVRYLMTQAAALQPTALRTAGERAMHLEQLAQGLDLSTRMQAEILSAEISAAECLDVPMFSHRLGSTFLLADGVEIPADIAVGGIEAALHRLDALSITDLERQAELIEAAVCIRWPQETMSKLPNRRPDRGVDAIDPMCASIWQQDHGQWDSVTVSPADSLHHLVIQQAGVGAYSGVAGTVAALSAQSDEAAMNVSDSSRRQVMRDQGWEQMATAIGAQPGQPGQHPLSAMGLGMEGIGGILRLLSLRSPGHPQQSQQDLAQRLINAIVTHAFSPQNNQGMLSGAAACIAPLIDMASDPKHWPALDVRAAIVQLGGVLSLNQWDNGAWFDEVIGRPRTGMLNGVAGRGLAVLRAGVFLDDEQWIEAGARALAFDRPGVHSGGAVISTPLDTAELERSWCSGDAGIGLSRAAAVSVAPWHPQADRWRAECHESLDRVWHQRFDPQSGALGPRDHLCCGNLGLAISISLSGAMLNDATLQQRGQHALRSVRDQRASLALLRPAWSAPHLAIGAASLMSGAAGMRLAYQGPDGLTVLSAMLT